MRKDTAAPHKRYAGVSAKTWDPYAPILFDEAPFMMAECADYPFTTNLRLYCKYCNAANQLPLGTLDDDAPCDDCNPMLAVD